MFVSSGNTETLTVYHGLGYESETLGGVVSRRHCGDWAVLDDSMKTAVSRLPLLLVIAVTSSHLPWLSVVKDSYEVVYCS